MNKPILRILPALLLLTLAIIACNLPQATGTSSMTETGSATGVVAASETVTPLPTAVVPSETVSPAPVPTPQDPLVVRAALCWYGPGPVYEVISALKESARVKLVGRGSIQGWLLVENPIYHVPCWVQDIYLQIDPGTDISILRVFTPPPTPTFTPSLSPTPTKTPTYTLTP